MTDSLHDPYAGHGPGRFAGIEAPDETGYAQARAGNLAPGQSPRPYSAQQVFAVLKALGYGAGQADLAMSRAITHGSWPLSRHLVRYDGESGLYAITPRRSS
jgi:hypothetical protein